MKPAGGYGRDGAPLGRAESGAKCSIDRCRYDIAAMTSV